MSRSAVSVSFDDHVAQALALVADQRPARSPLPLDRPQRPDLARVIPLPNRATGARRTRR